MTPYEFYTLVDKIGLIEDMMYGEKGVNPSPSKSDIQSIAQGLGVTRPR